MVDEDGLLVAGLAVVEILHDNRPGMRCFRFFQMGVGLVLPQPQMAENRFDDVGFVNEADRFQQF